MSPIRRRLLTALGSTLTACGGLGIVLALVLYQSDDAAGVSPPGPSSPPLVTVTVRPAPREAPPEVPSALTATVAFGGDMLTHMPVNASAAASGGYDFTPLLAGVDRWIAAADLAICQMEVPLAPPGRKPSGYPVFGAVPELVRDMAEQGWDGCTTSSNHSLDQGWDGLSYTLETLKANGMGYAGTALTAADAALPQLYRLTGNGQELTIAHIAATYGTNGIAVPPARPWSVNTPIDTAAMAKQAVAARAAGADVVLASIHAGVEYQTVPSAEQRAIVSRLAASGQIDAVIGDHPHVTQPMELVPGGVDGQGMWVVYSLGNFLSNQTDPVTGPNTDTGAVAFVTITKDITGARVTAMTWAGVTVDSVHGHRLYMLQDSANGTLGQLSAAAISLRYDRLKAIMGASPEQLTPPVPSGAKLEVLPRG